LIFDFFLSQLGILFFIAEMIINPYRVTVESHAKKCKVGLQRY